jgi:putative phage-type endonuclease
MYQRTEEWFNDRLGKVTASRVADVVARTKSGYSSSRETYLKQLVCERLTGKQGDSFQNAAMVWGINTEPEARSAYEAKTGNLVKEVGFIPHPTIDMAGASPDGMIDDDGLVEIKCPTTTTHVDTMLCNEVPSKYNIQMQWQMAVTGRKWCDFVSYDPRVPDHLKLYIIRVQRDDKMIADLESEVKTFLGLVDDIMTNLNLRG